MQLSGIFLRKGQLRTSSIVAATGRFYIAVGAYGYDTGARVCDVTMRNVRILHPAILRGRTNRRKGKFSAVRT